MKNKNRKGGVVRANNKEQQPQVQLPQELPKQQPVQYVMLQQPQLQYMPQQPYQVNLPQQQGQMQQQFTAPPQQGVNMMSSGPTDVNMSFRAQEQGLQQGGV